MLRLPSLCRLAPRPGCNGSAAMAVTQCDQWTWRTYAQRATSGTFYYDVLGLTPKASLKQIKTAYYDLSKTYHPDVNSSKDAHRKFTEISEAYQVLGNANSKRMYDRGMSNPLDSRSARQPPSDDPSREDYFNRRFRGRRPPPTGRTSYYNFYEYYKQHYGEQIHAEQMRRSQDRARKQYYELLRRQRQFALSMMLTMFGLTIIMLSISGGMRPPRPPGY